MIIMNLIVAIMITQMDDNEATIVLTKERIDDLSTHSEVDTLLRNFRDSKSTEKNSQVIIPVGREYFSESCLSRFQRWMNLVRYQVILHNDSEYANEKVIASQMIKNSWQFFKHSNSSHQR